MIETKEINQQFERLPPCDLDAEAALIGSMLLSDEVFHQQIVAVVDDSTMLYQGDNQEIFKAICGLRAVGKPVDALLIRTELQKRGLLEEIGGVAYLARVLDSVPSAAHGLHYAAVVREKWILRRLIDIANMSIRRAYEPHHEDFAEELVQETLLELSRVVSSGKNTEAQPIGEIVQEVYEQLDAGGNETIGTGFHEIDAKTGRIGIGEMVVIGARPSIGKSTLIRQIGIRNALDNVPTGIISLEENRFKIGRNLLSAECSVKNYRLRHPKEMVKEEWDAISNGIVRFGPAPLYVSDRARRIIDIRAAAAIMVSRFGIKLLIIDYLQRIKGVRGRDRYEQVSNTSLELSDLFKELDVAGVVVAQLNRALEGRDDKRPGMSDLRDSGQIEQDADQIWFLYREDYYRATDPARKDEEMDHRAEVIVAKCRDGIRGRTAVLKSDLEYQRFLDPDVPGGDEPPPLIGGDE